MSDAFKKETAINMLWALIVAIGMWNLNQISDSVRSLSNEIKTLNKFAVQTLHSHDLRLTRAEDKIRAIERNQDGNK